MKKPPAPTGGQEKKTDFNVPAASSNGWPVASEFRTTWPWQDIDVSTTSALLRRRRQIGCAASTRGHPHLDAMGLVREVEFPFLHLVEDLVCRLVESILNVVRSLGRRL